MEDTDPQITLISPIVKTERSIAFQGICEVRMRKPTIIRPKPREQDAAIDLMYKDDTYAIIGAAMEVHKVLGPGFLEAVYQEALEDEFRCRRIPIVPQKELSIRYKEHILHKTYFVDFLAFERILVEIKALDFLSTLEEAQLLNYLKASSFQLGLLINFGASSLQWIRRIITPPHDNLRNP